MGTAAYILSLAKVFDYAYIRLVYQLVIERPGFPVRLVILLVDFETLKKLF